MNLKNLFVIVCLVVATASVAAAQAASEPAAKPQDSSFRAEYLEDLKGLEQKFLWLANSLDVEKYPWRPAKGVRSIQDVLLHVSATNYSFPNIVGIKPPAAYDGRALMSLPADKTKVLEAISASFAHARDGVTALPAEEFERVIRPNWTVRRTLVFQLRHASEHLGQLIAYLRANQITPPWTEDQQRRQQQQPPAKQPPAKQPQEQ